MTRCTTCNSPDVVCVAPGSEPEIAPGGFVVRRGVPVTASCLACWPMLRGFQQALGLGDGR